MIVSRPDSDRYLFLSERVFDNSADDLEKIAVSKCLTSLLPQKKAVRIDLEPFKQETKPLAKYWCVKMEDDAHQPDDLQSLLSDMKTYLKAKKQTLDLTKSEKKTV